MTTAPQYHAHALTHPATPVAQPIRPGPAVRHADAQRIGPPSTARARQPAIRQLPGPGAIAESLATATDQVLAMGTLSAASPAFRYLGAHVVHSAVQFRALFPDTARTRPALCQHLVSLSLAGADVRTIAEIPLDAVVIDDRAVLLPVERSASSVAELTLPSAVLTARQLFERLWPEAVPLTDTDDLSTGRELTDRERETLRMLAAGATDEVIAAHLGIAVRTVRRTVSVLMNRLGARSRFQAGAKAAAQGWLLDPTGRVAG